MRPGLSEVQERRARALVDAVYRVGEDLLGRAQNLAPVEEGTLRASASLVLIVNDRRFEGNGGLGGATSYAVAQAKAGAVVSVDAEVSFNTPYAAAQHEGLNYQHPLGGQAKYLEQPVREQSDRYQRIIAAAVQRAT